MRHSGLSALVLKSQAPKVLDAGGGKVWLLSHNGKYLGVEETSPQPSTLAAGDRLSQRGRQCANASQGPLECTAVGLVLVWQGADAQTDDTHRRLPPTQH